MRRTTLVVLLGLALMPAAVHAQETAASAVRERVYAITDTASLRRIERGSDDVSAAFAALRLFELTSDKRDASRARKHFDRITERDPRNAWAHYGHALSLRAEVLDKDGRLVLDDALARGLGFDATSRARRALERAVALDPTLPGAADLLATYAIETRDGSALELSRSSFETAAESPDASVESLLGLARVAREMHDFAAASSAAGRAASRSGPLFAASHLELAQALASVPGRTIEAGEAYYAALDAADGALLDRMWDDVSLIARESEQERWLRTASLVDKRAALRAMWDPRAALAGVSPLERAAEHYARMNYAWEHFRRFGKVGAAPTSALRWQMIDKRYDDRGVIYIRHGAPAATYGLALQSYHVWMYYNAQGNPSSYHFLNPVGVPGYSKDFVLRRTLPCPIDPEIAVLDPRLAALIHGCVSQRSLSAQLRNEAERALATDSNNPVLERVIPFTFDWYSFRGPTGKTQVAVAFGVPLSRVPDGDPALRLDVSIADTAATPPRISRASASTPPIARRTSLDEIMRGYLLLDVEPVENAAYRVNVRDVSNARVGMFYGGTIDVRDYTGDTLMVSDIVLAEPREEGNFIRNGQPLALAPTQVFRGGSFRTYYEVYNLRAGSSYRTELTIEPARSGITGAVRDLMGRGASVKLQFDDVAPPDATSTLPQMRDVNAPLAAGDYVFRLTITTGQNTITRERRFTVPKN